MSIVTVAMIVFLIVSEVRVFLTTEKVHRLEVDSALGQAWRGVRACPVVVGGWTMACRIPPLGRLFRDLSA